MLLQTLDPALTLLTLWLRRLNCVRLCDAFSIQGAAAWIQWGYWLVEIFLYLLPLNAAHAISRSSAVLAGESGGARINEKWALHEIYTRIIRCNIHLSLLPRAWLHARPPEWHGHRRHAHTDAEEANYVRLLIIFCTTRGFSLKMGQTQNSQWQSSTGIIKKA